MMKETLNGQRNDCLLEQMFKGQESMLLGLDPNETAYLRFLYEFRIARMKGDEGEMNLLVKKIDGEEAIRMVSKLESQREIIIKATQLSLGKLSIEDPNIDFSECRQVLEHLLSD